MTILHRCPRHDREDSPIRPRQIEKVGPSSITSLQTAVGFMETSL